MGLTGFLDPLRDGLFLISARHHSLAKVLSDGGGFKYHLVGQSTLHDDVELLMESRPFLVRFPHGYQLVKEGMFAQEVNYFRAIFGEHYANSRAFINAARASLLICDENSLRIKIGNPEQAADLVSFIQDHFHLWMANEMVP